MFRKRKGEFGAIMSLIPILIVLPLCVIFLCMELGQSVKEDVEDALVLSCLAGALIDTNEYAESENIVIKNPVEAEKYFKQYMQKNLNLSTDMSPAVEDSLITGPIELKEFIVYNQYNSDFYVSDVINEAGESQIWKDGRIVSSPETPTGETVTETSIYAEVEFPIRFFFGIEIKAHVRELIAIE